MSKERKLVRLPELKCVPEYYEPKFDLNLLDKVLVGVEAGDKYKYDQNGKEKAVKKEKKRFVKKALEEAIEGAFGRPVRMDPSLTEEERVEKSGKFQPGDFGGQLLLNDLSSNWRCDIDLKVGNQKSRPYFWVVPRAKKIQAAHIYNCEFSKEFIADRLLMIRDGIVGRDLLDYPEHYKIFFKEGNLEEELTAFFSDYRTPTKSAHNQSSVFLFFKEQLRNYPTKANELVEGLKLANSGYSKNSEGNNLRLKNMLIDHRKKLVDIMIGERREFGKSHLLRRIDFALAQIESRTASSIVKNMNHAL